MKNSGEDYLSQFFIILLYWRRMERDIDLGRMLDELMDISMDCISYFGKSENLCEIKRVKLPSDIDYEGAGIELLDSLEKDEIVRKEEYIDSFEIIDSDTYLLHGPKNTYFCRFSTGEKTKIKFPWSVSDE